MRTSTALASIAIASISVAGCTSSPEINESEVACDRECLLEVTDTYLSALAANNPDAAPLASDVVFVENLQRLQPGEGLWQNATTGKTDFAIAVPDPELQQVGWLGMIERQGKPVMLALRLKLEGGRIAEAEHLLTEPAEGTLQRLQQPRPGLLAPVPEANRLPHHRLVSIGASYYDALDDNDGSKTPFADDCQRHENGMVTAGAEAGSPPNMDPSLPPVARDCKGQLDSNSFTYIDRIENPRMIAADPVTGLVMGLSHFRHPMDNLPYQITHVDGSSSERNAENMPFEPFDMPAAHIFKVGADGKVHEIEALGFTAPYNSPSGWE